MRGREQNRRIVWICQRILSVHLRQELPQKSHIIISEWRVIDKKKRKEREGCQLAW